MAMTEREQIFVRAAIWVKSERIKLDKIAAEEAKQTFFFVSTKNHFFRGKS
jgi:hypothetical protein